MKDAKQYRQYEADCRRMAATMRAELKDGLIKMADAWAALAKEADQDASGSEKNET